MVYAIIVLVSLCGLVAADQIIKYIVSTNMSVGQSVTAIDGLLNWTYVQNRGAAFGIMQGKTWFLVVVTALVILFVLFLIFTKRFNHPLGTVAALLVTAGGIGNLIDRTVNSFVVDYIDISPLFPFAVFNFADCCVTVGGVMLAVYILFFHDKYAPKKSEEQEGQTDDILKNESTD
ncbi:MAG: signal peptidase II [Oscillospiraceae bacterium]|jgi:signal peptidase II|nr:signal peptidase II [Oscillospiraceae bacterium]